jgi:hypothetical protein
MVNYYIKILDIWDEIRILDVDSGHIYYCDTNGPKIICLQYKILFGGGSGRSKDGGWTWYIPLNTNYYGKASIKSVDIIGEEEYLQLIMEQ